MEVITNNVPRDLLEWSDLEDTERKEFDYLDTPDSRESASFFRYKKWTYDLGEFQVTCDLPDQSPLKAWDGVHPESYFSGVVARYSEDFDAIVIGRFFC